MTKNLVIVESPAKAKTIEKFLGRNYKVVASIGHIRDLPKSKMGVDIENDYEPQYINIRGKGPIIKEIKKEAKKSKKVFLATDPDREGEAIAWHLNHILGLGEEGDNRIAFNEITKDAVKKAIKNPRSLDYDLIDAQQARRILDRLVGYSISPILWRKVKKGLSAGRVQSVATKMICDREKEIEAFIPVEFWKISVDLLTAEKKPLEANLIQYQNNELIISDQENADRIEKELEQGDFSVASIESKQKMRNPSFSYTTSSLQQDASNRLNFSTKKTMMIAQQLYEGIKLKEGLVGLITYMRTDSTRISEEAQEQVKSFIIDQYGQEYHTGSRTKSGKKNTQDAHEAIRPSSVLREPEVIKDSLSKDQFKLYDLIWKRFVSSQMSAARFENLTVNIVNGNYKLRSTGSKLIFDGYLRVMKNNQQDRLLPDVHQGESLSLESINKDQKFTQPPSRFTEASLVKEMEEKGIGRPSTYSPTISTILSRGYVERDKKSLAPTELGFIINDIMSEYFKEIVKVDFTAGMEKKFDNIESGETEWKEIIREFYEPFESLLEKAEEGLEKVDLTEETDIDCTVCGNKMVIKHGRYGKFLACSNYPECKNTKPILKEIGVKCPVCESGQIVERRTKKFKLFYGCSEFPNCHFVSWDKPVDKQCPECGSILLEGKGKNKNNLICSNKSCNYTEGKDED
jgi:DNA topoisomerase-1